ncbi:alpha-L-fucosidase [Lentzea sp. NPDC006480]|uniref:alpha-L-fucosidase n=1 Tax=Lentzea sp. NPDC006480 TaxID=3157176 RepID=UPI0033B1C280
MRVLLAVLLVLGLVPPASAAPAPAFDDPLTSSRTQWWRDAKFGMFVHFGPYSWWGGEYRRPDGTLCTDAEWIKLRCDIPWPEYEAAARKFNPTGFNADEIARLAQDAGQKYVVITSKHHDGFAMWPTRTTTWNLHDHSGFQRDVLAELKRASERRGLRFGLYYSINDWHDPGVTGDAAAYKQRMREQLRELVTTYHPATLWFDGQGQPWWSLKDGDELQRYLRSLDPALIINDRVAKSRFVDGDHETPERHQNIPQAPLDAVAWESCITTSNRWGWTRYDTAFKPSSQLTRFLTDITGRGGNMLLNVGPDDLGRIPAGAQQSLRGVGDWLRANGKAVYGTSQTGLVSDPGWGAVTRRDDKLYLSVHDWNSSLHLSTKAPFDVLAARVLGSGQRVRWQASGDGFDVQPSGQPTSSTASVIELTIRTPQPVRGNGSGLTGEYFDGDRLVVRRTDPTLNFPWRETTPAAPGVPLDNFSARWTGSLQASYTGPHTLLAVSDETVKVWLGDQLVIDGSKPHGPRVDKAAVNLEAGRKYPIRVEYADLTGEAYLKLLWANPYESQRVVPTSALSPV